MGQIEQLLQTEIYDGKSLADLLTLEMLASVLGNTLAAILILVLGFVISGWVRRRIVALGTGHRGLDDTLFHFLGNIARYAILGFALLFVLNTFGVRTTSLVARATASASSPAMSPTSTILGRPPRLDLVA